MGFVPLHQQAPTRPADFPRVSVAEQEDRDAEAERIVLAEFSQDMPDENRTALESEFRQRFGKEPPVVQRGFVPLADGEVKAPRGFVPLEPERPSVLRNVLLNNPATAIAETGANLLSQGVALPAAGLAGIGVVAGKALGLTDADPAEVVHKVGGALTYQPRGEMGQAATAAVMAPFEKLAEVGQGAGNRVLDATGSPVAATAVDTAINALPMAIAPAARGAKVAREKLRAPIEEAKPTGVDPVSTAEPRGFIPLERTETAPRGFVPIEQQMPDPIGPMPALDPAAGPLSRAALNAASIAVEERVAAQEAMLTKGDGHVSIRGSEGGIRSLVEDGQALYGPDGQKLDVLRGAGRDGAPGVADQLPATSAIRGGEAGAEPTSLAGADRPGGELRTGERGLAESSAADYAPEILSPDQLERGNPDHRGNGPQARHELEDAAQPVADPEGRIGARGDAGLAPLPEQLQVPDTPGTNLEPARVGEAGGRAGGQAEPALAPGRAAGAGADALRPEKAGFVPLRDSVDAAAHEAATSPLNDKPQPTPAQIEAGTYAKGHINLHGLPIAIENPKGSIRRGTDASGREWQTEMQQHYGYIKRSTAKDGDHVDVFIGERPESTRAFVIDQVDPKTGKYDEAKVILGALDEADARQIYLDNYEPGWQGLGAITPMEMDAFKEWIKTGDTKKPVALDSAKQRAEPDATEATGSREVAPPIALTLNDIPPSLLKKVKVPVEQIVGDEVKTVTVSAREALTDLKEEIGAYEKVLADVGDGSKTLADSMAMRDKELKGFDSESVLEAAKDYQARGLSDGEASVLAVQDHLRELNIQRQGVVDGAIAEFRKRDPEKYAERLKKAEAAEQNAVSYKGLLEKYGSTGGILRAIAIHCPSFGKPRPLDQGRTADQSASNRPVC